MPTPLRELRARPDSLRADSLPLQVLDLLRSTPEMAWRPVEISEKLGVDQRTLSPTLTRLARRGLIDREKGHWYALDDSEVAKRQAALLTTRAANARHGREDRKDWPRMRRK